MHKMNRVNVELTTRTGLVNDGRARVRRRGVPPPICLYASCHVFIQVPVVYCIIKVIFRS